MNQAKRNRPTFGRTKAQRGLDQFDTPPIALEPLFCHEPLLAGVTAICEPFCGKGNLVTAMRAQGITVHASDIVYRGCPDSTVLDFLEMTQRARRTATCWCRIPPFAEAMKIIEHAFALGFRVVDAAAQGQLRQHGRAPRTSASARTFTPRPCAGRAVTGHARRQFHRRESQPDLRTTAGSCSIATIADRQPTSRCRSKTRRRACPGPSRHPKPASSPLFSGHSGQTRRSR